VDDIANVMNGMKIAKAHIVGLSMGAYAALIFGLRYKSMVRSLVIAGVGSGAMPEHRKSFFTMANELAGTFIKKGSKAASSVISNSGSRVQFKNKDPRGWNEFKNHLENHSAEGSALTMQQYQALRPSLMDFEKELKKINIPVFLAIGDEDELCLEINLYLKRQIKTSGLWISPKTGHAINLEEPAEFNSKIQNFFSTVERGQWKKRDKESIKDI
jgi:pimeloyl-ACP methyl ester carboxylesterase